MQSSTLPMEHARVATSKGLYRVNEMFYSLQGEGRNAGTPMVFIRFADCNLRCTWKNAGFDCDTEFTSGIEQSLDQILQRAVELCPPKANPKGTWLLLTGGEPGLSVDKPFIDAMKEAGYRMSIETNGTVVLPTGLHFIAVSPKSAEHTIRQKTADEVRYVRHAGMGIPVSAIGAAYQFISPAFQADGSVRREDLEWCQKLVLENPAWSLSLQIHKLLNVR